MTWSAITELTSRHLWAIYHISVLCGVEKATKNKLSLVVTCWLPAVCRVSTCSTCTPSLCDVVCFIKNLESFGKLPQVWLLSFSLVAFRTSLSGYCGLHRKGTNKKANKSELAASIPPCYLAATRIMTAVCVCETPTLVKNNAIPLPLFSWHVTHIFAYH